MYYTRGPISKVGAIACTIAVMLGAPPQARPADAAYQLCGRLDEIPALRAAQGVWAGEWWVRDRAGNVLRHYRTEKTQRLFGDTFYQVTEYDYPDRPDTVRQFFARFNAQCEVEFYGVGQPAFAAVTLLQRFAGEHAAVRLEIERATGKVTGAEYFTQIGPHRLMSAHRFDTDKGGEPAPVVTVYETRLREAPTGALFDIPKGQYWESAQVAPGVAGTDSLALFVKRFSGEFDNREQVAQEAAQAVAPALRHSTAHFSLVPLEIPGLGRVTYVEQYRDGDAATVTYQRIFTHALDAKSGEILSLAHELPADRRIALADLTTLKADQLKALPASCVIRWRRSGAEFRGRQSPESCHRPGSEGQVLAFGDELLMSDTEFWTNTRITTPGGSVVYANGGGVPLKMRRVP